MSEFAGPSPALTYPAPDPMAVMGEAVLALDAEGCVAYLSPAWAALAEDPPEPLFGRPLADALAPADRPRLLRTLDAFAEGDRRPWRKPVRLRTEDGTGRWVRLRLTPHHADGRYAGCAGVVLAMDDDDPGWQRVVASVVTHAADAVIVTDAEPFDRPGPVIRYVNDALVQQSGYAADELVGRTPRIFQGPGTDRATLDRIRAALEAWQPVREELLNYRKDGSTFWVDLSIVPVADDDGWFTHWVAIQRDVTRRKEMELALRESEERFRGLVANLPGVVYRCAYDRAWTTLFMSDAFEAICGYPSSEFEGNRRRSFRELVAPEDLPRIREAVRAALAEGDAYEVEYRIRHADGTVRWIADNGRAYRDADGRVRYLDGTMFDVTERRATDVKLRMLEAAVQDATESVLITGTELASPGPEIVYVNRGFERMTGYAADEVLGQTPRLMQGPETSPEVIQHLRTCLAAGDDFFGETINYRKDGTPFNIEWSISAVRDAHGEATHYVAVQRDITERKRAEQQLRLLQSAVANAQDAVMIVAAEPGRARTARVAYVNEAFERTIGFAADDVRGRSPVSLLRHSTASGVDRRLIEAFAGGQPVTLEVDVRRRDGTDFPAELSLAPVRDADGAAHHWVIIQRDLTATKRFEAEREARERAEEMVRAKSTFLNNMSHEIRTPLTAILGFADVLQAEVPAPQREFVDLIDEAGKRLLATLNSVLDLARLESQEVAVRPEAVDATAAAHDVVRLLAPLAAGKGLRLAVDAAGPVHARVDAGCLDRILHNLVSNAVKFTEAGEVVVAVRAGAGGTEVAVRDTGIGIEPAFLPSLFEEFKQESEGLARSHEGSGLGLAITKRLVDLVGGTIDVASTKGEGTTFTVVLPPAGAADEGAASGS